MENNGTGAESERTSKVAADKQNAIRQDVARVAESVARTAELSADVHDEIARKRPGVAEHAERDRRLASAERASAAALRDGEVPPDAAREVIRAGGRITGDQDEAETSGESSAP